MYIKKSKSQSLIHIFTLTMKFINIKLTALTIVTIENRHHTLIGLYYPLDDITNLKYKLLCFLTLNKINFKEKGTSFKPR
jgi:hypothetical protein